MAKRKNHTNHNQNRKDHRNGIKKARMPQFSEFLGLHPATLMRIEEASSLWNASVSRK
ncbi:ribosomal protein L29 [Encephalitozoon hellem]|uniref:60S ribosomal protein L29 n=1 Tax=Encephalitozoon hellem TaxID=27973 RepID=A0A9Q9C9Y4_ENCHE|nr:ribosomal L29e-like protein [Encephalitozoon hellem ATCC 50504]AHL28922.1 ribosomal L29e-like protein [Encephalitozoon hellem ATCC 50504]KAG5859911.1 ribosomal protein L29 [Encephalitozoon hellem]UTX42988.1 ribosomal L29e-like protein [Encephalitozoon hellem]WEL38445.1 ribosomal L29e-like protein [Encephalitozoon hellem]